MKLVTLDFETYFAQDYSLTKMTSEEYVRDPRFKVHCIGLKGDGVASAHGPEIFSNLPSDYWADKALICHHAHFDGLILAHHYGICPAFWFDTLSMARMIFPHLKSHSLDALATTFGLPNKTVPYNKFKGLRDLPPDIMAELREGCANDVELTYQIFQKLALYVPKDELRLIDTTIRMFTEPCLALDAPRMERYLADVRARKENLLAQLGITRDDLHSADRFAKLLRERGVEPPVKISPSDPDKMIYAFAKSDDAMKALQEHESEEVQILVSARLGVKSTIGETRSQRLIDMGRRGALCVYLKPFGAHTLRWAGGDKMNWQNFTRGSEMRLSITAPRGCVIVVVDSSQIECRELNWLAGQQDVLDAFAAKRDLYSEGASRFYGRTITKADKLERHMGKTLELGCGYGMGWTKLQLTCRAGALGGPPILLSDEEAKRAIQSYRQSHPCVTALWRHADTILQYLYQGSECSWGPMQVAHKRIYLPNGAALDYSNLDYDTENKSFFIRTRKGKKKIYGAALVENVIQALSRLVVAGFLHQISACYKVVMTTHDEIAVVVPEALANDALEYMLQVFRVPPAWNQGVPLDAEGGFDVRYSK